jgi:hypothetical protein
MAGGQYTTHYPYLGHEISILPKIDIEAELFDGALLFPERTR